MSKRPAVNMQLPRPSFHSQVLRSPELTQSIRKASALGTVTGSEGWVVQTRPGGEEAPGFLFVASLLKSQT